MVSYSQLEAAYREGFEADVLTKNPYSLGSALHWEWSDGQRDAWLLRTRPPVNNIKRFALVFIIASVAIIALSLARAVK